MIYASREKCFQENQHVSFNLNRNKNTLNAAIIIFQSASQLEFIVKFCLIGLNLNRSHFKELKMDLISVLSNPTCGFLYCVWRRNGPICGKKREMQF